MSYDQVNLFSEIRQWNGTSTIGVWRGINNILYEGKCQIRHMDLKYSETPLNA